MITFNKVNELYNEIIYNDIKIGHVEKHSKHFTLEISYLRVDLKHSKRKLIGTIAKKIYLSLERRKAKARIGVSILQTGFKTLE